MAIDNSFIIKKIEKFEYLHILYSTATKLPFIECDDETFDDQIYAFTTEEMTQAFARRYITDKILLNAVKIPNDVFQKFFRSLYLLGVNAVMIQDEGAPVRVQLSQLCEAPDISEMKNTKVPAANPEMQLTGIYFMQELTRPIQRSNAEKKHLHELEEEMAHNLLNSPLILTMDTTGIEGKWNPADKNQRPKVPMVTTKNGKSYQPVYTEIGEVRKFMQQTKSQQRLEMLAMPYEKLEGFLVGASEGFVFNPGGFNLILNRDQYKQMLTRYKQEAGE
ncbi:MAG: SseB family protein [Eubacteriales bacterium]|nr:SseB family protein [Eubacteriales bacterium]